MQQRSLVRRETAVLRHDVRCGPPDVGGGGKQEPISDIAARPDRRV